MDQIPSVPHEGSQRYNRYEQRVLRIRHRLDWIRRHRVLLIVIAALIVLVVVCFLLTIGSFIGQLRGDTLIYGEKPEGAIRAFLSDIQYQFAPAEGEPIWSDTFPTAPGEHRMRAVSKNGFGQPRYSDCVTVTILPRDLTVRIHDGTFVYGSFSPEIPAKNTELTGLAPGNQVRPAEYTIQKGVDGGFAVSLESLQIVDSAGRDVTACYRIVCSGGYFTMVPRPITVHVADARKVYDGQTWNQARADVTEGTLVGKDTLETSINPAPAEAGVHLLEPRCVVLDENGENVTACYQIHIERGYLTVDQRPITVQTGSASKEYDTMPLANRWWSVLDGDLVEGHSLEGTVTGSRTAVGQSPNTLQWKILDTEGGDVSGNYAVSVEEGTLTVTPIVLTFKSGSGEKVYDGTNLTVKSWWHVSGETVRGHTVTCYTSGIQCDVGSSRNTLSVIVMSAEGLDITAEGYRIEVDYGTLTVTPRPITITSESAEKLYDGSPLICHSCQLPSDSFNFGDYDEYIIRYNFTGMQTEVGSSPNTFTVCIGDKTGKDTTYNYSITYIYGTLRVLENPNPLPPKPGSGGESGPSQPGSGQPGSSQSGVGWPGQGTTIGFPNGADDELYAQVNGYRGFEIAQTLYFRHLSYGDYTGYGWNPAVNYSAGKLTPLLFAGSGLREDGVVKIYRFNDCPVLVPYFSVQEIDVTPQVSDCYYSLNSNIYTVDLAFGYDYRDLKHMTISSYWRDEERAYRQFVHEQYLQIPDSTRQALSQWAAQNGIRADSPTLVEDIQVAIRSAAAYNLKAEPYPQDVDVAVYFLTEAREGICQHFATAATLMYRAFGIPARYTTGFADTVQEDMLTNLTSKDAHAWVEVYVDGRGWVPVEVTPGGSGQVEELRTELYIQAGIATKIYDGKPFDRKDLAQCTILSGKLREGHRLVVTMASPVTATEPGNYTNDIARCVVYDENGQDVTEKFYNIHLNTGRASILRRPITVTLGSASKVYDGRELVCEEAWVSCGALVLGQELAVVFDASLVDPGTVVNTCSEIAVLEVDDAGRIIDRTAYYDITVIFGKLTVMPDDS